MCIAPAEWPTPADAYELGYAYGLLAARTSFCNPQSNAPQIQTHEPVAIVLTETKTNHSVRFIHIDFSQLHHLPLTGCIGGVGGTGISVPF